METEARSLIHYFVNGEVQSSHSDDLTVRKILTEAGSSPAEDYRLIRDSGHHEFKDLDDVVEIHEHERFTAIFCGPTPTS
jgi:hypothetical protein